MFCLRASICLERVLLRNVNICRQTFIKLSKSGQVSENTQLSEEHRSNISQETRQHTNKPFLKNVFAGIYDSESLIYPESLSKSELAELNENVLKIQLFFNQKDGKASITNHDLLVELKKIGLVGSSVSEEFGGENFKATKVLRLFEEVSDESIASLLYAHNNLGIKCLYRFGSDEIKEKYLPRLTSGKSYIAYCAYEDSSGSDFAQIKTRAKLSGDKSCYVLNGEKTWVINADKADFFVVFAKTEIGFGPNREDRVTGFLVEKASNGISFSQPYETIGFKDLPVSTVKFHDIKIPVSNVIGDLGIGFQMSTYVMYEDMFINGGLWSGILKNLSKNLVDHCIKRKVFGSALKDFGMIQDKLANLAMNIYAIESMSYMTAGVFDSFVNPDVFCESAAVKVFGSESVWLSMKDALQILGSEGCKMQSGLPNALMNAATNSLTVSTNEILKLYIALNCLKHAGLKSQQSIRKRRNSLNNIGYLFQESLKHLRAGKEDLNLKLYDHVHPELSVCGELLEKRIFQLKNLVLRIWSTSFTAVQENQFMLKRLADIAINLYAINASLARASRSKAIGLKNCDDEVILAQKLFETLLKKIDENLDALETAYVVTGDLTLKKIGEAMIKNGGYAMEHPLTRNW